MTPRRPDLFVYPALGGVRDFGFFRVGGPGLANMLLSWARAAVAAERLGATLLTPAWFSPKIGPLLRRERDTRMYLGVFRRDSAARGGPAKALAFARARRTVRFVDPTLLTPGASGTLYLPDPHVIAPDYFAGLFDHQPMLTKRLLAMVADRHVARVKALPRPDVAVHVRLGDFAPAPDGVVQANTRLPVTWYTDRMAAVRTLLGPGTRFTIFSDGTPEQLAPILALPGAELRAGENAIVDLLAMARARALIASTSTFSLWAAFLGRMPSLWHPGGLLQAFPPEHSLQLESATGAGLPTSFAAAVGEHGEGFEAALAARA